MRKVDRLVREFFQPKQKRENLLETLISEELQTAIANPIVVNEQVPVVVNLNAAKEGKLNEDWLFQFGGWIETILGRMFGMNSIPVTIKGTREQVESFGNTLNSEKHYIDSWRKYGLDDARTHGSKATLDNAIKQFEYATNLKYPFKG